MVIKIDNVDQKTPPGLYEISVNPSYEQVRKFASEMGWHTFFIDGTKINNKESFLKIFSSTFSFPDYFGFNWDAFDECITEDDLFTGQGYIIYCHQMKSFAKNDEENWKIAVDTLQEVVQYWTSKHKMMYVLFSM